MSRTQILALVGACSTTTTLAADACFPGIVVNGLGSLDGDYMTNPAGFPNTAYFENDYSSTAPQNAISYGCGPDCSEDDEKKYSGKWVIREFWGTGDNLGCDRFIGKPCRVLAVCTEGCPGALPDKGHDYWWPSGASAKKWDVISEAGASASTDADVSCCKRKADKCDSCSANTCATISPLSCNPITKLIHPCCTWYSTVFGGQCICKATEDLCDHGLEDVSVGNVSVVV
jgi:hypothetical protein